jgi:hypothetical protein
MIRGKSRGGEGFEEFGGEIGVKLILLPGKIQIGRIFFIQLIKWITLSSIEVGFKS